MRRLVAGLGIASLVAGLSAGCGPSREEIERRDAQQRAAHAQQLATQQELAAQLQARITQEKLSYEAFLTPPSRWDADTKATVDLYERADAAGAAYADLPLASLLAHLSRSRRSSPDAAPGAGSGEASTYHTRQLIGFLDASGGIADDKLYMQAIGLLRQRQRGIEDKIAELGDPGDDSDRKLYRSELEDTLRKEVGDELERLQDARSASGRPLARIPSRGDYEIRTERFDFLLDEKEGVWEQRTLSTGYWDPDERRDVYLDGPRSLPPEYNPANIVRERTYQHSSFVEKGAALDRK